MHGRAAPMGRSVDPMPRATWQLQMPISPSILRYAAIVNLCQRLRFLAERLLHVTQAHG